MPARRAGAAAVLILGLTACGGSGDDDAGQGPPPPEPSGLSLHVKLDGAGQVISSPRGADCLADCDHAFEPGITARVLAVPARDRVFAGWEGGCQAAPQAPECTLPESGELSLVARFEPRPPDDAQAQWRQGDLHTHSDHSSDGSLPRQAVDDAAPGNMPLADIIGLVESLGADYLPITDHRTYDHHYDPNWESQSLLLIPGEEANGRPHATVHGAVDMIDQNAAVEGAPDSRVVQESIWLAHSQGASWVTAHPDRDLIDDEGQVRPAADAVGVDLVEVWNRAENVELEIDYAENRWNAGWRFGVAGASDNHFKELWALGGVPARPATELLTDTVSERAIIDALRAGRSNVFSRDAASPRVRLDADFDGDGRFEVQAGEEVFVPAGTPGQLRVRVDNGAGSRVLVYAAPGRSAGPLAQWSAVGGSEWLLDIEAGELPSWYRAEVRSIGLAEPASLLIGIALGPYDLENIFQELLDQLRALSSPIFVSEAPSAPQGEFLPPADAGSADGAEYAFGAPGEFAGFADAAYEPGQEMLHLAAEVHEARSTRVQYAARRADGHWTAPQPLSDSARARFPRIAVAGANVVAVWQDERAGQIPRRPQIWLRRSRDGGAHFGAEIALRAPEGRAMHPDVALDAAGIAHVVWQEIQAGMPFDVFHATVDAEGQVSAPVNLSGAGKTVAAASPLDSRSARYPASVRPAISVAADGVPVVVWQDNRFDADPLWTGQAGYGEGTDPDDWQIAVLRLDGASELQYLGGEDAADRHPDVIVDGSGRTLVVWDSKPLSSAGVNLRVLAAERAADSASFGAVRSVSGNPASSARQPRLGLAADGTARLAWFDSRSADWRWRIMSAAHDGQTWANARLHTGRGNNSWPVPAGPFIALASTRNAQRLQRDRTQQIYLLGPDAPLSAATAKQGARPATPSPRPGLLQPLLHGGQTPAGDSDA